MLSLHVKGNFCMSMFMLPPTPHLAHFNVCTTFRKCPLSTPSKECIFPGPLPCTQDLSRPFPSSLNYTYSLFILVSVSHTISCF